MSNRNVTKIERLSSGMVKLYDRSNVIGSFSALNSIAIGYENNNARTIEFTHNGGTISFQLFNLQEIVGSTTTVTYDPIQTTDTSSSYSSRVFDVFNFLSDEVVQGFSPGPTYVGGVVAAYPNFASFPVTGTQSVIYIDEADNSAYYWDGSSYQLLVSTGVEQYATFASFPVTGSANVIYIDMSVPEPYVWDGAAYESMGGGTAVWGGITGTLSAQTDLQAALDAKFDDPTGTTSEYIRGDGSLASFPAIPSITGLVPYTGATSNVDLGEYELKAGQLELDQTPTGTAGVAVMRWNDTDGTVDIGLKGGNVTLQTGQEMVIRAVNKSGGDLLEANYQAVRLRLVSEGGASGQRLAVKLALADSDINSATTIGLVTETINNNQEGFITTIGVVRDINTTGSLQGETWVDGDILYLSPTVAGQLTNIKPVAPDHLVVIGYVEYAHAVHGKIYVKCDNGYELNELHNVYINAPTTWQVLRYDSTAGYWTNSSLTASILPGGIDASKIGTGTVDNTEFGYLNGVTSSIQTQIDGKQAALGFTAENTANKQNSLATDGTGVKFPTVDAVNTLSMIDRGKRMVSFFTDFLNAANPLDGLQVFASGGSITSVSGAAIPNRTNQQGVVAYNTIIAATNYANHVGSAGTQFWFGNGVWNYESSFNINNLSTGTERYRWISGYGSATAALSETDGVFFTYDEGGTANGTAASPNWQCVTVANSVRTLTTTSTAVTAAAWAKLRIEINAAGTQALFYLNGTLVATHTTNIPLGSNSRFVNPKQGIAKTIGVTARIVYCDYLGYENILTTAR